MAEKKTQEKFNLWDYAVDRDGDLNDDGRTDIAVAGKSGTYVILNRGPVDQ